MKLTQVTSMLSGDWLVFWSSSDGDFRGISRSDFITALKAELGLGLLEPETQYYAPAATGFSVTLVGGADGNSDVHLVMTPVDDYAAGTIVLPVSTGLRDKQTVIVNSTHAVTALTVSANGASAVVGAPTTLAAGDFFKLCYDDATSTWYRVG